MSAQHQDRRNARVALAAAAVAGAMVVVSFASVPLYRLFCQATGFGGTPQRAERAPARPGVGREIAVRFNADIDPNLPWSFAPAQYEVKVKLGEQALAFYRARNRAGAPATGQAMFNVTPLKAGPYFAKLECFCFREQTLAPGQSADMPVSFYLDPALAQDPNMDEVRVITLSYTFYRAAEPKPARTSQAREGARTSQAREGAPTSQAREAAPGERSSGEKSE